MVNRAFVSEFFLFSICSTRYRTCGVVVCIMAGDDKRRRSREKEIGVGAGRMTVDDRERGICHASGLEGKVWI